MSDMIFNFIKSTFNTIDVSKVEEQDIINLNGEYATVYYDKALDDYYDGKRRAAYYKLRVSALAGYPAAQYLFGHMLFDALYPVRFSQPKRGIQWFKRAAESGNSDAQYDLGNAYFKGIGVEQDKVLAVQWYKKAADNGNPKAQNDSDSTA